MRRTTLFLTVFATMLLANGTLLLDRGVQSWPRLFMAALLIVCFAGGWVGERGGRMFRPLLPVWAGAFTATSLAMAIFVLTGAALASGNGPIEVWTALVASFVYAPVLVLAGAAAAPVARAARNRV